MLRHVPEPPASKRSASMGALPGLWGHMWLRWFPWHGSWLSRVQVEVFLVDGQYILKCAVYAAPFLVCMILVIRVGIPWLTFNVEK
jgi:hypothetical protein